MDTRRALFGLTFTYITWSLYSVWSSSAKFGPAGVTLQAFCLFLFFLGYCKVKGIKLCWEEARQSFVYSVARVLSLGLMFYAFLYINVGIFNTIGALSIFLMAGIFAPLAGEKFRKPIIIPLVISIVGVALVSGTVSSNGWSDVNTKYVFAFAAMIAATFSIVLWRKCVLTMPATNHITYMHGWTTLLSLPLLLVLASTHTINSNLTPTAFQFAILAVAAIAGTVGDFTYSFSQKHSTITLNGLFTSSGAIFSCLLGWLLLGQTLTSTQLLGIFLIVASVAFANYITSSQEEKFPMAEKLTEQEMPRAYEPPAGISPGVELDVA